MSALLSPNGTPARVVEAWRRGHFEMVVSARWHEELTDVLARPWLHAVVPSAQIIALHDMIRAYASDASDPEIFGRLTPDPGDDYLVALARSAGVDAIVSGDSHLIGLEAPQPPVLMPRQLATVLGL